MACSQALQQGSANTLTAIYLPHAEYYRRGAAAIATRPRQTIMTRPEVAVCEEASGRTDMPGLHPGDGEGHRGP